MKSTVMIYFGKIKFSTMPSFSWAIKFFLSVTCLWLFPGLIVAQFKPANFVIPSPNASSLGAYVEMPVSYFTGLPTIGVPIYSLKGKKIGLDISLSYHAAGLRPEAHPGWVGNGWSLQAGGVITRKEKGKNDEYNKPSTGKDGYYFTHNNLNSGTWSASATIASHSVVFPPLDDPNAPRFDADAEPDEFSFSFLDFSGKFFLDQNGNWQVQSDRNLKVVSGDLIYPFVYYQSSIGGYSDMTKTFSKFTLIDDQGTQYVFGTDPAVDPNNTAIEFSEPMIPNNHVTNALIATSWYLSQIISADGSEQINLTYERGPLTSYIGYAYNANQTTGQNPGSGMFGYPPCSESSFTSGYNGSVIFPVYLKKIEMPSQDAEIDFNLSASNELTYPMTAVGLVTGSSDAYSAVYQTAGISVNPPPTDFPNVYLQNLTSASIIPYFGAHPAPAPGNLNYANRFIWLKLDGISIYNKSANVLKRTVSFNYNNNSQKRLQLNNLQLNNQNGQAVQTYLFNYNATALPGYLATITDHWGFNNNNTTYAGAAGFPNNFYAVREPDQTGVQTQAEILTSITYPTGGSTTYTYEPNTYSKVIYRNNGVTPTAETGIAGGIRIKQIVSTDNNGNSLTKKLYYVNGYTAGANPGSLASSGVLDSKPVYNFTITGTDLANTTYTFNSISSNPVIPLTTTSTGNHIGYSAVVEQRPDGSYSIYQFSNHDNGYGDELPLNSYNTASNDYFQSTSLDFERGRLLSKADYNSAGSKVAENTTTFSSAFTSLSTIPPVMSVNAVSVSNLTVCANQSLGAVSRTAYLMHYFPFSPASQSSAIYDVGLNGTGTGLHNVSTVNNVYDQYRNLTQQDNLNSDGTIDRVKYNYAYNYTSANPNNPYNLMVSLNMISLPIERIVLKVINGTEYRVGGEIHTYQLYDQNKLRNDKTYVFENIGLIPFSNTALTTYSGINSAGQLQLDNHYVLRETLYYDDLGNVTTVADDAGHANSFIWDYNKAKVVAKVINANNIYQGVPPASNVAQTNTFTSFIPGQLNNAIRDTVTVTRTGPINFSFVYNNPYVSGNNSATLQYQLTGNSQYQSGSICTSTNYTTSNSCGSSSATGVINNVAPGTYIIYLSITGMTGFQNYYGFTATVSFPTYKYFFTDSNKDIAYTSFEYPNASSLNYGAGNWNGISLSNIVSGGGFSGSYYYNLSGASLSLAGLKSNQSYTLSYWSKNGSYTVSGSQSVVQGPTLPSGWTNFQHRVSGVSTVAISGSGALDELQFHPSNSQMVTYTYEPLVGVKSTVDAKQQITNYHYDNFQRLADISDQNGSLMKAFAYNYAVLTSKPVINSLSLAGTRTFAVGFVPVSNCIAATVTYTDAVTNQSGSSTGGCNSVNVTVPVSGHTYHVSVTCFTSSNGSFVSDPADIYVP